ncbi:MAG: hypothetical protein IKZ44_00975 [Clostridia bacterium]|nr:hypothetical protein [Clostridia bacterium]
MKRIIAMLLLTCTLVACVPTPDHEFVINKQDADTDTAILQTAPPIDGRTDGEAHETLAERLGAPAHRTEETFDVRVPYDMLTVCIDADVHVPDTERVGVYTVTFDVAFSETQQKALILKYLGEERPFLVDRSSQNYWRKWEIEEEIVMRQKELEWFDKLEDKEMRELVLEQGNEQLQQAMESYKNATEDWKHLDWDGTLSTGRGESAVYLSLYANTDQPAHYKRLALDAYSFRWYDETLPTHEIMKEMNSKTNSRSAFSYEPQTDEERAAAELAVAELQSLGIGSFAVKSVVPSTDMKWQGNVDWPETGLIVNLWHTVDGLPFYDFQAWHGSDDVMGWAREQGLVASEDYSVYMPGQISASVGVRDGRVVSIEIDGLHHVTGCVNENVQLLPFETIMEIFKEQIAYHYFTGDIENPDSGKGETLYINDIHLSMMRVRKKDSPEEFYLMPVWDFTGYFEHRTWPLKPDEIEKEKEWASGLSYLTINAVDGTIIDRDVGY